MKAIVNLETGKLLCVTLVDLKLNSNEIIIETDVNELSDNNYYNFETKKFYKVEETIYIECPAEVSLWKLRVILKLNGLEQIVGNALESLDDPIRTSALYIWNYGTTIDRESKTIQYLQGVLQFSDSQIDDIFINANTIIL